MPNEQTTTVGELVEREWSDKFGSHYEAKIACANGMIVSKVVTKYPFLGWADERAKAAADVRASAAAT